MASRGADALGLARHSNDVKDGVCYYHENSFPHQLRAEVKSIRTLWMDKQKSASRKSAQVDSKPAISTSKKQSSIELDSKTKTCSIIGGETFHLLDNQVFPRVFPSSPPNTRLVYLTPKCEQFPGLFCYHQYLLGTYSALVSFIRLHITLGTVEEILAGLYINTTIYDVSRLTYCLLNDLNAVDFIQAEGSSDPPVDMTSPVRKLATQQSHQTKWAQLSWNLHTDPDTLEKEYIDRLNLASTDAKNKALAQKWYYQSKENFKDPSFGIGLDR